MNAYWAKLERNLGKDLAAARGVWENTIKKRYNFCSVQINKLLFSWLSAVLKSVIILPAGVFWKFGSSTFQWRWKWEIYMRHDHFISAVIAKDLLDLDQR